MSKIPLRNSFSLILVVFAFHVAALRAQDDGGNLCGPEPEEAGHGPYWILRFEILDAESRTPLSGARVTISDRGYSNSWQADQNGVAVLVVSDTKCIPSTATLEITYPNYQYYASEIEQWDFVQQEDDKRIMLEGHMHNWTDGNQIPTTQELINKVRAHRYQVGIRQISSGYGFSWVNYAPALFEYRIELQRLRSRYKDN